jgi:hypothetical protein
MMVSAKVWVALPPALSVTRTVKLTADPAGVGVPLMTPVLALRLRPPGRDDPVAKDHV